jgi:hypothetical protein
MGSGGQGKGCVCACQHHECSAAAPKLHHAAATFTWPGSVGGGVHVHSDTCQMRWHVTGGADQAEQTSGTKHALCVCFLSLSWLLTLLVPCVLLPWLCRRPCLCLCLCLCCTVRLPSENLLPGFRVVINDGPDACECDSST